MNEFQFVSCFEEYEIKYMQQRVAWSYLATCCFWNFATPMSCSAFSVSVSLAIYQICNQISGVQHTCRAQSLPIPWSEALWWPPLSVCWPLRLPSPGTNNVTLEDLESSKYSDLVAQTMLQWTNRDCLQRSVCRKCPIQGSARFWYLSAFLERINWQSMSEGMRMAHPQNV